VKAVLLLLATGAFVALMAWTTLRERGVHCEVCVALNGRSQCSTANAADEAQARQGAFNNACGTLSDSVSEDLACRRVAPVSVSCTP